LLYPERTVFCSLWEKEAEEDKAGHVQEPCSIFTYLYSNSWLVLHDIAFLYNRYIISLICTILLKYHGIINPRHACAARVTVLGLCVCVSVCVSVCLYSLILALKGPSRSSAIPTALAQQGLE